MNHSMKEGLLIAAALGLALAAAEALTTDRPHRNIVTSSIRLENAAPLNPFTTSLTHRGSLTDPQ